jgi:hypothetical protein
MSTLTDLKLSLLYNRVNEKLQTISKAPGPKGDKGERGERGDPGPQGKQGPQGVPGKDGIDGAPGKDGSDGQDGVGVETVYEAADGQIVFVLTNGEEHSVELPLDLLGAKEQNNYVSTTSSSRSPVSFVAITTTPYYILETTLINGHNIFGVNTGSNATVYLPPSAIDPTKLIVINNEMQSYTITVESAEG